MYDNIGKKIKGLAMAFIIIGAVVSVIMGMELLIETEVGWYAFILFGGPIVTWISSWLHYGYGVIIDKLSDIQRNTEIVMRPSEQKRL